MNSTNDTKQKMLKMAAEEIFSLLGVPEQANEDLKSLNVTFSKSGARVTYSKRGLVYLENEREF